VGGVWSTLREGSHLPSLCTVGRSAPDFKTVSDAVLGAMPDSAVVVGLEVSADSGHVSVWTTTHATVVGPRGHVAESIRRAVSRAVGRDVRLTVELADGDIEGESATPTGRGILTRTIRDPTPRPRIPHPTAT
jgi:hypothetical protein